MIDSRYARSSSIHAGALPHWLANSSGEVGTIDGSLVEGRRGACCPDGGRYTTEPAHRHYIPQLQDLGRRRTRAVTFLRGDGIQGGASRRLGTGTEHRRIGVALKKTLRDAPVAGRPAGLLRVFQS